MRLAIQYSLENGERGSRFPILQETPDHKASFTMEQTIALKEEIGIILREKDNLREEYTDVPYLTWEGIVPKDFRFPRGAIIDRLGVILKGCEIAIMRGGELGWVY